MALLVGACDPADTDEPGTEDAGSDDAGEPTLDGNADGEPGGGGGDAITFADVAPILSACGCHVSGAGGLVFDGDPYGALVEVPSSSGLPYVEPGDVEGSYLVHKVRGLQGMVGGGGDTMPPGGMLTEEQIGTIEAWIAAGAVE